MTGYSRHDSETALGRLTIELKAWNHRHSNITVRLPSLLSQFEHRILSAVRHHVHRGQAQVGVELSENDSSLSTHLSLNVALAKEYHAGLTRLQKELRQPGEIPVSDVAKLSGVFTLQQPTIDEDSTWHEIQSLLKKTLDSLDVTKRIEGRAMSEAISQLLNSIKCHVRELTRALKNAVKTTQGKLEARLNELFEGRIEIDQNRLAMEAGVIASRTDVTEELVRLESHCAQFEMHLQATNPVGRQLDFLLQEMNREVNTITSKASELTLSSVCVSLKTEIEKIREIVQNVE